MAAGVALEAGHVMVQGDSFAHFERPYARAEAHNGSGGFMTEDARRRDGSVMDFLDIGWTNATNGHLDQQFMRADARHLHGFEPEVIGPAVNDRSHCFWQRQHARVLDAVV
jgi:hypothetical protein